MARTCRAVATSPSPEGLLNVARTRGVSWLRAAHSPSRLVVSGVVSTRAIARYSGGTAPDLHRLPELPSANIDCLGSLRPALLRVKRARELSLQLGATTAVRGASGVGDLRRALHLRIELGDLAREALRRTLLRRACVSRAAPRPGEHDDHRRGDGGDDRHHPHLSRGGRGG